MLAMYLLATARRNKERDGIVGWQATRGRIAPAGVIGLGVPEAGGNGLGRIAIETRQFQRARSVVTETPVKVVIRSSYHGFYLLPGKLLECQFQCWRGMGELVTPIR